jgi:hypothetical protein
LGYFDLVGCEVAAIGGRLTSESNFSTVSIMAKQPGVERYQDFLIAGSAIPSFATGFDWYSQGTIFRKGHFAVWLGLAKRAEAEQRCASGILGKGDDRK